MKNRHPLLSNLLEKTLEKLLINRMSSKPGNLKRLQIVRPCGVWHFRGVHGHLKAAKFLLSGEIFAKNLMIYSDTQAEIRSLTNVLSTPVLVNGGREFLIEI